VQQRKPLAKQVEEKRLMPLQQTAGIGEMSHFNAY
jgi:hypothetical protein